MGLVLVEDDGLRVLEGSPDEHLMSEVEDARHVIEACLSGGADAALLYPDNLTEAFFDLSSGQAGAILQKLRNYGVRLAVVCSPGTVQFSSRFGEVLAEERHGRFFGVFGTRREAVGWLRQSGEQGRGAVTTGEARQGSFGKDSVLDKNHMRPTGPPARAPVGCRPERAASWSAEPFARRVDGGREMRRTAGATPRTIDEYLAPLSGEKRAALQKLRGAIKAAAPDAEECISYQIPAFRLGGRMLVAFGAAAKHCAFYAGSSPVESYQDELKAYDTSKGTIRFQPESPLPASLVRKLVDAQIAAKFERRNDQRQDHRRSARARPASTLRSTRTGERKGR